MFRVWKKWFYVGLVFGKVGFVCFKVIIVIRFVIKFDMVVSWILFWRKEWKFFFCI